MKPEIESTIKRLDSKLFDPDPIAGQHFSKITSVMSSAYKRHGYILERAILETLRLCPHFEVWRKQAAEEPATANGFREPRMQRMPRIEHDFHVNKIPIVAVTEGRGAQDMVALVLRRRIG